jgi:anti-anti-sigma regulatory factor
MWQILAGPVSSRAHGVGSPGYSVRSSDQEGEGVRLARSVATLDRVDVGDHVCWVVDPGEDFAVAAGAFLDDGALAGDKVLLIGPGGASWARRTAAHGLVVLDPTLLDCGADQIDRAGRISQVGWDAALLGRVRDEADAASREGFRALRVLAQMQHVWPDGADAARVAGHELSLDALAAERGGGNSSGTIVVCAYPRDLFAPAILEQAVGVHPQHLGTRQPVSLSFRIFSQGPDSWSVSGVVDAEGAAAFHAAVSELLTRSETVRLSCADLALMDAAGMRALAGAAGEHPGRRVVLRGANPMVRRCWSLLGYDDSKAQVEMAP